MKIGVHVIQVDEESISSLTKRAEILGYFNWQDLYEQRLRSDQPTTITSIRSENQSKRIVRYNGDSNAPIGLLWIENDINQLVSDFVG